MRMVKKVLKWLAILVVTLVALLVVLVNSSFVIKMAADKFAPDYNITYSDIRGNVFTGITIDGLAYNKQPLVSKIRFHLDPSQMLYKTVKVNTIALDGVNVDTIKTLAASFETDEAEPKPVENNESTPFPLKIKVATAHITVSPFKEQGIAFEKVALDAEDIFYAADEVGVDSLSLKLDTDVTQLNLKASLDDGVLKIGVLDLNGIDSEAIEKLAARFSDESNTTENTPKPVEVKNDNKAEDAALNPMIPKTLLLEHFNASLKPRTYKNIGIEKVVLTLRDLKADVPKLIVPAKGAVSVGELGVDVDTNVTKATLRAGLRGETVTIDTLDIDRIDTMALQQAFAPAAENNETNATVAEAALQTEEGNATAGVPDNPLIPKMLRLKHLHVGVLPALYDPVQLEHLDLNVSDLLFAIDALKAEKGTVTLRGQTNLANLNYDADIADNHLKGRIVVTPNQPLFDTYKLPLRKEAIGDIAIGLDASREKIVADLDTKMLQLLQLPEENNAKAESNATTLADANTTEPFNIDVPLLKSHIVFVPKNKALTADSEVKVDTPYAKGVRLTNHFVMDGNISYRGSLRVPKIIGIDEKLTRPLNNFTVAYGGTDKAVHAAIDAENLKGSFVSDDFKKGLFLLSNKRTLQLDSMASLPKQLAGAYADFSIKVPLDFAKVTPLDAEAKITSNLSNVNVNVHYADTIKADVTSVIPKNSLLRNFDKNLHLDVLSPLKLSAVVGKEKIDAKLTSHALNSTVHYLPKNGNVDGVLQLAGLRMNVKGSTKGDIDIKANVGSVKEMLASIKSVYTVPAIPKVEGKIALGLKVKKLKEAELSLNAPHIVYHTDRKSAMKVDDIKIVLAASAEKVALKSYTLTYDGMKIYATKPSIVNLKGNTIEINPFWLNDQLKVVGTYDLKQAKGKIDANAAQLHIKHKFADIESKIDLKTLLNGPKTNITGKVVLLGGKITYDLGQKSFPSDSDVIIVQDIKKKKKDEGPSFMDGLSTSIFIKSKEPLVYNQSGIDIKAMVDLSIQKSENAPLFVLGDVTLLKGGSYQFQEKKFVLDKSKIYFIGDPSKPRLDITAHYTTLDYFVKIQVTGTPAIPVIEFSSVPPLKREQILSLILFGSVAESGSGSGEEMMKMMGGAMAKSALANAGVKLDHLVIGSGGFEVGKKIMDDVTAIYIQDEIPTIKLQYDYSRNIKGDIQFNSQSTGVDVLYRKDFKGFGSDKKDDDIVIKRKKQ